MYGIGAFLAVQWLGSMLPLLGVWVRSLVGELRSHMLHGMAKKQNKINRKEWCKVILLEKLILYW